MFVYESCHTHMCVYESCHTHMFVYESCHTHMCVYESCHTHGAPYALHIAGFSNCQLYSHSVRHIQSRTDFSSISAFVGAPYALHVAGTLGGMLMLVAAGK